ncbi:Imidazoleglycerol-phosphate dehydratase [Melioribacter roseus P3M-2]|uniref:Imidazoleglycerol-phosphate dehydratase n=1 Tax=Melioribacter roseus (strain DSM 23840 / JCM 17771 / VKM B-2668 / P3M-2) TaxID=1191523 RepID=I6YZN0_MELRP|nr:imidazoleglycerol-phosphate dehydratase HisB [Melioribacter roseus]AFN76022.1 Imidazoleglycerol-phosphate dehydratase [Melioribacter roseus P3M-2]
MNRIYIAPEFFNMKAKASNGLLKALFLLRDYSYSIESDIHEINPLILEFLNKNGLDITGCDKQNPAIKILIKGKTAGDVYTVGKTNKNVLDIVTRLLRKRRSAKVERKTKETDIKIAIDIDGEGKSKIKTGIGFFDHMLDQIARHSNINLKVDVKGDLDVDEHHTVEDTGIALGEAIKQALGDKKGIKRFGYFLPMDDSIAKCAIDLSGRNYLNFKCKFEREKVGQFPTELTEEFFRGVALGMMANIYLEAKGKNDHHKIESMFKAFAKSLNEAFRIDERAKGQLPSTKGKL